MLSEDGHRAYGEEGQSNASKDEICEAIGSQAESHDGDDNLHNAEDDKVWWASNDMCRPGLCGGGGHGESSDSVTKESGDDERLLGELCGPCDGIWAGKRQAVSWMSREMRE